METDIERVKLEQERKIAQHNSDVQFGLSMINLGQTAIKSAILINGGAAIALLAFVGNVWNKGVDHEIAVLLANAIGFFASGVLVAVLGTGTTYFSQHFYQFECYKLGLIFHSTSIGFVVASYCLFCWATQYAHSAFIGNF